MATFSWDLPFPTCQGFYDLLNAAPGDVPTAATGAFTASLSASYALRQLSPGANYFHIVPVDSASNVGTVESTFEVQINTLPPAVDSASHTNQTVWVSNNNVLFDWSFPQGDANAGGVYYVIDHDGSTLPTTSSAFIPTTQHQVLVNLSDGVWAFHAVSVDRQGYLTKSANRYRVLIGSDPGSGSIVGEVTDATSAPVAGALVTINHGLLPIPDQTTSSGGTYSFTGVPAGTWEVDVTMSGYRPGGQSIAVAANATAVANVALTP
jgi:hypothetical protein